MSNFTSVASPNKQINYLLSRFVNLFMMAHLATTFEKEEKSMWLNYFALPHRFRQRSNSPTGVRARTNKTMLVDIPSRP